MRRLALAILLPAVFDCPVRAGGETLYFRLEPGGGEPVLGCFLPTPDGDLTALRLDLDGDGLPSEVPRAAAGAADALRVALRSGGRDYTVKFHGSAADDPRSVRVSWWVRKDGDGVRFSDAILALYASREEAARGVPLRMGPPFSFEVRPVVRGPRAAVLVILRDSNGAALRGAWRGVDERRVEVSLFTGPHTIFSTLAPFGCSGTCEIPVAVPTDDYRVACTVDLAPLFAPVEGEATVRIEQPPPDILDRRLGELASADLAARRQAAEDLRYFTAEAGRVVPALVAAARDPQTAEPALRSLCSFPESGQRPQIFLAVLFSRDRYTVPARLDALWALAAFAPRRADVEFALREAGREESREVRHAATAALRAYLERTGGEGGR